MNLAFISDSVFKTIPNFLKHFIHSQFNIKKILNFGFPGITSQNLFGAGGEIYSILKENNIHIVLLSAGQNDVSKLESSYKNPAKVSSIILEQISESLKTLAQNFPKLKIVFLPLTKRCINKARKTHFPKSRKSAYILKVNKILLTINDKLLESCKFSNLFVCNSRPLLKEHITCIDGLHLTSFGKEKVIKQLIIQIKQS